MSASHVKLTLENTGVFHVPDISSEAATKASEVLQENHDNHHIFFNKDGFHNHIAHHILTLYAIGASPAVIQRHYDHNKSYQRPPQPLHDSVLEDLHDYERYHQYLGDERYYFDFLNLFQSEIDKKGYETVIHEYCLKGDERANDMLVRLHSGFFHPMIHLGFGIEFKQPAIIAEALAQTAVHSSWIGDYLLEVEKVAVSSEGKGKNMVDILDRIHADKKLSTAAEWDDSNKIRDGILVRAPDEMIRYGSEWKVGPSEIIEKTAEMTNAAVYYTGGAQHPPKEIKFDFYYMHCLNSTIFYDAFLKQSWISDENKARLLAWKGRLDLCMYASRRSPRLLLDEIISYTPKKPSDSWDDIFSRVCKIEDDGHAAKLIRALAHGENICTAYNENDPKFRVKGDMWLQLGHMAIDSVENTDNRWVRSAGFEEAWEKFQDRPRAQL